MVDLARKAAAIPAWTFWIIGAVLMCVGSALGACGDWLDDVADRRFRRACERKGHRMGDWWLGYRHCARCDWTERMPDELRPDILGRRGHAN
jgi:hypothetical protein